jgi:hypothetical protein
MLEKEIENIIADYPDEFFPNEDFHLISRQFQIESRRFDLLFEDKHKRKIIIEVKSGTLTREASGQIAEYYGLMKMKNQAENIELILVANIIPNERRTFLESIGISCKEISEKQLLNIAMKKGIKIESKEIQANEIRNVEYKNKTVDTGDYQALLIALGIQQSAVAGQTRITVTRKIMTHCVAKGYLKSDYLEILQKATSFKKCSVSRESSDILRLQCFNSTNSQRDAYFNRMLHAFAKFDLLTSKAIAELKLEGD